MVAAGIDASFRNGNRRDSLAQANCFPEKRRALRRPLLKQSPLPRNVSSIRATPLGPVAGRWLLVLIPVQFGLNRPEFVARGDVKHAVSKRRCAKDGTIRLDHARLSF